MNFKIVSDSSSDVFELEGIDYAYAPLKITCGEKQYTDTPELNVAGMIEDLKIAKTRSGTSCPNIYEWQQAFEGADNIFAITITSQLSGSYSAAMQAKEEYIKTHPETKIHVIDSLSTGPEMHLIIDKLKELIDNNLSFEDITEQITEYSKHTNLAFCLESLNNLARNGRVNPAVAKITGILGIRLVGKASDKGTLEPVSKPKGAKKSTLAMYQLMLEQGYKGGRVIIDHVGNPTSADSLKEMILSEHPNADISIGSCGGLCSFYAEERGMLVGYES